MTMNNQILANLDNIDGVNGVFIAAPASSCGKTLITLAILRALTSSSQLSGKKIASIKTGPDYIDPAFHRAASGNDCINIDSWAMRPELQMQLMQDLATKNYLLIAEGVMGLFDGALDGYGSTADLAAKFNWPIIMIMDVTGQAASAVASLKGFYQFRQDVNIAAVIFNRVASKKHQAILKNTMEKYLPQMEILGYLPKNNDLIMPSRHLGLDLDILQARDNKNIEVFLNNTAAWLNDNIDLDKLINIAKLAGNITIHNKTNHIAIKPLGQNICIAKDAAFSFFYQSMIDGWRAMGANISFFSPLNDDAPNDDCDAIYLPGGYPELYAGRLSNNKNFINGIRSHGAKGSFIYGECGGYMTLGNSLIDGDGISHKMAGLLPISTSFFEKKLHLGYRQAELLSDCHLGVKGTNFKGHEFHYASITSGEAGNSLFNQRDAFGMNIGDNNGNIGYINGNICGSYLHLIDMVND